MENFDFQDILEWVNLPIIHIGQVPLTVGGLSVSLFTVLAFILLASFIQKLISNRLIRRLKLESGTAYALSRIFQYLVIVIGIIVASQMVGLNFGSLAVVFGFLSVGIGFGLQNITSNFISGLILLLERPLAVGDLVTIEEDIGRVTKISMRATSITTFDNVILIIPNSKFIENQVINWSYGDAKIRIHCPIGVAYGSDTRKVKATLLKAVSDMEQVLKTPAPEVRFLGFGDSSLNFELLAWTAAPDKQFKLQSEINYAIEDGLREADIRIPFPQRDLHLQMTPAVERLAVNPS